MTLFRGFLVIMWFILLIYTGVVIANHGANLIPVFFGDMLAMAWPGQFNLDFMGFLALSALWTAWRAKFSAAGLGLGVVAFFGGIGFLAPYLFYLTFKRLGDIEGVLMGDRKRPA
ncbi:MAG: hypothetical protein QNI84_14950 [Henriciella sp.]|nr:hypothetical protein [Henriciella sp.]